LSSNVNESKPLMLGEDKKQRKKQERKKEKKKTLVRRCRLTL
jgi:hypothetical protein